MANRKVQVLVVSALWVVCLVGAALAARSRAGLPQLAFPDTPPVVPEPGAAEHAEPPAEKSTPPPALGEVPAPAPPQGPQAALLPPVPPPAPVEPPTPPEPTKPAPSTPIPAVMQVKLYRVQGPGETMKDIARQALGDDSRWPDIQTLNPGWKPDLPLPPAAVVRLPGDAQVGPAPAEGRRPKARNQWPATGTYAASLDECGALTLPATVGETLGSLRVAYLTPGAEGSLWLCSANGLERLTTKLKPAARRLYYGQTERVAVDACGRLAVPPRLVEFAGLRQDVVVLGAGDHVELWDAGRWQEYVARQTTHRRE